MPLNLPTDLPTIMDTAASPVTFTTVLHISKGLSTANIRAKPIANLSDGKPIDSNTITVSYTHLTLPTSDLV